MNKKALKLTDFPKTSETPYTNYIFSTDETGGGEDYMPPYMTVYAWYRIA